MTLEFDIGSLLCRRVKLYFELLLNAVKYFIDQAHKDCCNTLMPVLLHHIMYSPTGQHYGNKRCHVVVPRGFQISN